MTQQHPRFNSASGASGGDQVSPSPVQPVPLWLALLLFGVPGVVIYLAAHLLVPAMVDRGIPLVFAWTVAVVGPTLANAGFVLSYYYLTERPTFHQFVDRFRLHRPGPRLLWLAPLTVIVIVAANELLAWTVPILSGIDLLAPPEVVPEIFGDVYETLGTEEATFMGEVVTPAKLWLIPFWLFFWVFLAVFGEEIVWRGYVLPAHELQYGWRAWVINGILWNVPFHLYTIHNFFSDMPLYFLLPLLVYWRKNTWYGIACHSLLVSIALVILVPGLFPGQ